MSSGSFRRLRKLQFKARAGSAKKKGLTQKSRQTPLVAIQSIVCKTEIPVISHFEESATRKSCGHNKGFLLEDWSKWQRKAE